MLHNQWRVRKYWNAKGFPMYMPQERRKLLGLIPYWADLFLEEDASPSLSEAKKRIGYTIQSRNEKLRITAIAGKDLAYIYFDSLEDED